VRCRKVHGNGNFGNFTGLLSSRLGQHVPWPGTCSKPDLNEAAGGGGRMRVVERAAGVLI
jgi:hypothetical protein